jgi:hypothetical protein
LTFVLLLLLLLCLTTGWRSCWRGAFANATVRDDEDLSKNCDLMLNLKVC